jgi:hypothetical protein
LAPVGQIGSAVPDDGGSPNDAALAANPNDETRNQNQIPMPE